MDPRVLAGVIEALLVSLAGVCITLSAYGIIGKKPPEGSLEDERRRRNQQLFRIIGPVLAIGGLLMAGFRLAGY